MPVSFAIHHEDGYFVATWKGRVSDAGILEAYRAFFQSAEWKPGLNELADLGRADFSEVTARGLRALVALIADVYASHNVAHTKCASYAPQRMQYGLSRLYEIVSEGSPETTRVFRDFEEAREWVAQPQGDARRRGPN